MQRTRAHGGFGRPPGPILGTRLRPAWPLLLLSMLAMIGVIGVIIGFSINAGLTNQSIHELGQRQEPIGFYAYKSATQFIPAGVFTTVIGWTVAGGSPAYDASDGAMNLATGVWTTRVSAKYQVSAAVCWTVGSFGSRQLIFLTNGNLLATPISSFDALFGIPCNTLSMTMDLTAGTTIEAQVLRSSVGVEVIAIFSTFSIERILGDS